MEGGAYGAFSYPRNMDGLFLLGSYRDPNITAHAPGFRRRAAPDGIGPARTARRWTRPSSGRSAGRTGPSTRGKRVRLPAEEAARHHRRGPPGPPHVAALRRAHGHCRGRAGAHPVLVTGFHGGHRQPPLPAGRGVPGARARRQGHGSPGIGTAAGMNLEVFVLGTGGMMPLPGKGTDLGARAAGGGAVPLRLRRGHADRPSPPEPPLEEDHQHLHLAHARGPRHGAAGHPDALLPGGPGRAAVHLRPPQDPRVRRRDAPHPGHVHQLRDHRAGDRGRDARS